VYSAAIAAVRSLISLASAISRSPPGLCGGETPLAHSIARSKTLYQSEEPVA
jgi:hypothetical protein